MPRMGLFIALVAIVASTGPESFAAAPAPSAAAPSAAAMAAAQRVDRLLESAWSAKGIQPAPQAGDAEFLRRVYLDIAGRIPTVAEVRAFLADKREDKRRLLIADLLRRPTYSMHFTDVWRSLMLPETNGSVLVQLQAASFDAWLHKQLDENVRYDAMVREVLTTSVTAGMRQIPQQAMETSGLTPSVFYLAKDLKAENLASATARVFLGIRLECAQCHDHPFAEWKRDQFWSYAAFFAGIKSREVRDGNRVAETEEPMLHEIAIPGGNRMAQATFPDNTTPKWDDKLNTRKALADWVTNAQNPYFAKATVNRMWSLFFGIGLVEPIDEMVGSQETVIHHAEVLNELARSFVDSGFDLKFLIETIVNTRAYQLTSGGGKAGGTGELYSRHPVRGLTAAQLFDSVGIATGAPHATPERGNIFFLGSTPRSEFVSKFGNQSERPTDYETSILQALTVMNGKLIADATNPDKSQLLASVLNAPFFSTKSRIETFYLATLSRMPTPRELTRATDFVNSATVTNGPVLEPKALEKRTQDALADVLWTLLNSGEFLLNH